MTRKEVILKAIEKRITWLQAASILGISDRQMRRLKVLYDRTGFDGLQDQRGGKARRKRIPLAVIEQVLQLKRELYPDFSVAHFHQFATARHGIKLSETWMRHILQDAGLVERAPARGKHRRRRERQPMRGMLLHLDASTHAWLPHLAKQDLNVLLDDADGTIVFAEFVAQEGTMSTFRALEAVLRTRGRFCEFYTDRGSHFCTTSHAGQGPDAIQGVQIGRALKALGIQHILARSPQARGRSERAFRTIQGRLPQELRAQGIMNYAAANAYLQEQFVPAFNERFGVQPAQSESAYTSVRGIELDLLLSIRHERIVRADNTVSYKTIILQLPASDHRVHFVRCPVDVHEFTNGSLGVAYQGRLLARFDRDGQLLSPADRRGRHRHARPIVVPALATAAPRADGVPNRTSLSVSTPDIFTCG